jgi:hypothetical protein
MITQIFDSSSNKIRAVKDMSIKHYTMPFIEDNKTVEKSVKGIYFTIVGKTREWPNWISIDDFQKFNPDINIDNIK